MLYAFLKVVVRTWLLIYHRVKVEGLKHVPHQGPFILVGNHVSYLDPFYIGAVIPHHVHFMAKKEAFEHPLTRWFLNRMHAFPVKRGEADLKAIRQALSVLQEGKVLGIFPEGGRRDYQELEEIKQGAAYLALKMDCPVIPVLILGADRALPRGKIFLRPAKIQIKVGNPISLPSGERARQRQEKLSAEILDALRKMKASSAS